MVKTRFIRSLGRKVSIKAPLITFFLFCEGQNTEPQYFKAIEKLFPRIMIHPHRAAGDPSAIAKKALIKHKEVRPKGRKSINSAPRNSFEAADQVWAIFDRDTHAHFDGPIKQCNDAGIGVAASNPCFELWLTLHKCDFDQALTHTDMQKHFQNICPDYDRKNGKTTDFLALIKNLSDAERRAEGQINARKDTGDVGSIPYTTVFLLTRAIREAALKNSEK
jgi:RloB-like protein